MGRDEETAENDLPRRPGVVFVVVVPCVVWRPLISSRHVAYPPVTEPADVADVRPKTHCIC